jgi:hypothetical protein
MLGEDRLPAELDAWNADVGTSCPPTNTQGISTGWPLSLEAGPV